MKKRNMKAVLRMAGVVVFALVSTQANAQKDGDYNQYLPQKGSITTEVMFNPFSSSFETFKLSGLKARYFLTDKDALRLNVNFDIDNFTTTNVEAYNDQSLDPDNYTIRNAESEIISKNTTLKVSLGYERHFCNTGRIDVYAGGEAGYERVFRSGEKNTTGSSESKKTNSSTITTATNSYSDNIKYDDMSLDANGNEQYEKQGFFFNVFTGMDFYIYKGLYIGTELGISFASGKTYNKGTYTQNYNENAKTITNSTYGGTTEITTETIKTNWTYSPGAGKLGETITTTTTTIDGKQTNNDSKTFSIQETGSIADAYTNTTKLKIYIEPALRLGWRF